MNKANERQVKTTELTFGMFVSNLDRPWLESPIAFSGFTIKSQSDIDMLQRSCQFVYVDLKQGVCPPEVKGCIVPAAKTPEKPQTTLDEITHHQAKSSNTPTRQQHEKAVIAYQHAEAAFNQVEQDIRAGTKLNIHIIGKAMLPLISSVQKNPDCLFQLIMLSDRQATLASDAITTATLATAIGQRIRLSGKALYNLAIGGLLYDVGKLDIPAELLNQPRIFTPAEFKIVRNHVDRGVKILNDAHGVTTPIIEMAQHHHERFDGSGYPTGLRGEKTSSFARIAAIVDCYNAITSHRPHAPAMSPYSAALKLYEWRDVDFDTRLVEKLIQVIGVYPIGTPVELSSGEIAVVIAHNRAQRLKPMVAVLLDKNKTVMTEPRFIDLSELSAKEDTSLTIQQTLPAQQYPLDFTGLLDHLYQQPE